MTPQARLIEALRALCKREGGHAQVADRIEANDQTIYQILAGVKLPSGEPRGVGPKLQRKLEAKFPGWSALADNAARPEISPPARRVAELLDRLGPPDSLPFLAAHQRLREVLDDFEESGESRPTSPPRPLSTGGPARAKETRGG